jgi:hypothetical protein
MFKEPLGGLNIVCILTINLQVQICFPLPFLLSHKMLMIYCKQIWLNTTNYGMERPNLCVQGMSRNGRDRAGARKRSQTTCLERGRLQRLSRVCTKLHLKMLAGLPISYDGSNRICEFTVHHIKKLHARDPTHYTYVLENAIYSPMYSVYPLHTCMPERGVVTIHGECFASFSRSTSSYVIFNLNEVGQYVVNQFECNLFFNGLQLAITRYHFLGQRP